MKFLLVIQFGAGHSRPLVERFWEDVQRYNIVDKKMQILHNVYAYTLYELR